MHEAIKKYFPDDWIEQMLLYDIAYIDQALKILKEHNLHKQINEKRCPVYRDKWTSEFAGNYEVIKFCTIKNGEVIKQIKL